MKISRIISSSILIAVLAAAVTGCLKDKDFDNRSIQSVASNGSQKIVEIQLTAANSTNFLQYALDNSNTDTTMNLVPVVLNSAAAATEDVNVTLALNPTLINDYNTANGTAYSVPSPAMYTIVNSGLVVTIPKGSHTGYLQVKFKPSDFLGADWALGFTISSIDKQGYTISGNLNNGIAAIGIKNKWDGHYRSKGNFTHPNPAFTSAWGFADGITRDLITFSGNGDYIYPLQTRAVTFGVELDLTINGDNTVTTTFVNTTDDPDEVPNPSHYDPVTKTFFINAYYGGHTRHLVDTLEYVRPR